MCDTLQKKYYFFGAGGNCHGAINFWGKDSVIAIIDNSDTKIGHTFVGVPIISYDQFIRRWNGETIIITAYLSANEIVKQLEKDGIDKYFACPSMQSGFYDCIEMINRFGLRNYKGIDLYDDNPISDRLCLELLRVGLTQINIVSECEIKQNDNNDVLLLVTKENFDVSSMKGWKKYKKVIYLFDEIKKLQKDDYKYLQKYKNIYNNEKCFLIGNGPSLNEKDLDRIYKYKIKSFGCNRINKIFSKTMWRPDYYIIIDSMVWEEEKEKLLCDCNYFMRKWQDNKLYSRNFSIQFYYAQIENYGLGYPEFSDNITECVFSGRTAMYDMLQIAVYMGFREIYLLGVDFSWGEDGRDAHFCKDYFGDNSILNNKLMDDARKRKEEVRHAYISARNYADAHGIKIYNATRGGNLDVFERVDIDKLFGEFEKNEMQSVQ